MHYAEERAERDAREAAELREYRRAHGTHYCANCAVTVVADPSMRRLNPRTYEYEFRCDTCGSALDSIAGAADPSPLVFERDVEGFRSRTDRPRPKGLDRPSYRDDD
jgi:ribosomal protein L34E